MNQQTKDRLAEHDRELRWREMWAQIAALTGKPTDTMANLPLFGIHP